MIIDPTEFKDIIPFYNELSSSEKSMVEQNIQLKSLNKGSVLADGFGSCQGFILVKSGEIAACMLSEDGREVELFSLTAGEMCILSASCIFLPKTFHVQMTAEKFSEVYVIPSTIVAKLREQNMKVELFAYKAITSRFANVMNAVEELFFVPVEKRLAKMLLKRAKMSNGKEGDLIVNITQEVLAKKLGTAREVVSRTLSTFKEQKILEVKRGQIIIKKPSGLQLFAQN